MRPRPRLEVEEIVGGRVVPPPNEAFPQGHIALQGAAEAMVARMTRPETHDPSSLDQAADRIISDVLREDLPRQ